MNSTQNSNQNDLQSIIRKETGAVEFTVVKDVDQFIARAKMLGYLVEEVDNSINGGARLNSKTYIVHIGNGLQIISSKAISIINIMEFFKYSAFNRINLSNLDFMFKAQDISYLFHECSSLEDINFGELSNKAIMAMKHTFFGCGALKSIDLSSFDTHGVEDITEMFAGCGGLEHIDLSHNNLLNVKYMEGAFTSCKSLKSIKLPELDLKKIECANRLFLFDTSLEEIAIQKIMNYDKYIAFEMFEGIKIKRLHISEIDLHTWQELNKVKRKYNLDIGEITYDKIDKQRKSLFLGK